MSTAHVDAARAASEYRAEGYAILRGLIPPDDAEELRRRSRVVYAAGMAHPCTYRHGNLVYEVLPETHFPSRYVVQAHWPAWEHPWFDAFRSRPEIGAVLAPLLGDDVKQVAQQIHWKPPGAGLTGYRFHQDLRFRDAREAYGDVVADTVTVGIAIDRCTRDNGCLRVVPRSHLRGYLGLSDEGAPIMKGLTSDDELRGAGIDPSEVVDVELEPGDAVIWGLLTVHGSLPNHSARDRAFMISSYVRGTSARGEWAIRGGSPVTLGPEPSLCKFEDLDAWRTPRYVETAWYTDAPSGPARAAGAAAGSDPS